MVDLCEAVEVLADPAKRALYDRHRADPNNIATREAFESAAAAANARARQFPEYDGDLQKFLSGVAADVQKTRGGRIMAGVIAGLIFGALLASLIGYFMALNIGFCAIMGALVGAVAGAFGAASNE